MLMIDKGCIRNDANYSSRIFNEDAASVSIDDGLVLVYRPDSAVCTTIGVAKTFEASSKHFLEILR